MKIITRKLELLQNMANPDGKWTRGLDCGPRFGLDLDCKASSSMMTIPTIVACVDNHVHITYRASTLIWLLQYCMILMLISSCNLKQ